MDLIDAVDFVDTMALVDTMTLVNTVALVNALALINIDQNEVITATLVHLPIPRAMALRADFLRDVGIPKRTLAAACARAEARREARDHLLAQFAHLVEQGQVSG